MRSAAPHFDSFVRAVHRRLVLLRALERAGLGAAAGCAASSVSLPLLLWRGEPATAPAVLLIAMGALAGLWWGIVRRPSRLVAAMEADRQLDLHDLLGTAAGLGAAGVGAAGVGAAGPADPWLLSVLALADERCRRHAPSQVVLRRFGSRAWGGIGLAACGVVTLAALLGDAGTSPAVASRGTESRAIGAGQRAAQAARSPAPSHVSDARPGVDGLLHESRKINSPDADEASTTDKDRSPIDPGTAPGRRTAASGRDGTGGGTATGTARPTPSTGATTLSPPRPRPSLPRETDGNRTAAGGGAESAGSPSRADLDAAGGTTTSAPKAPPSPEAPWESSEGSRNAGAAQEPAEGGPTPQAYRDLVRQYFDR